MKNLKTNKKGHYFAIGLFLTFLVISIYVIVVFSNEQKKNLVSIEIPQKVQELNLNKTTDQIYTTDHSFISLQQTFQQIALKAAVFDDSCEIYNNYVIWNDNCNPKIEQINGKFIEFLKISPDYKPILDNQILKMNADTKNLTFYGNEGDFELNYSYNPSFSINLTEIRINFTDFPEIYSKINSKINECKSKDDILNCISMNSDRWIVSDKSISSGYLLLNFSTTRNYLFADVSSIRYAPIFMAVALKIN